MGELEASILDKLIRMFSPCSREKFLQYDGADVIKGPNDRAVMGYDNYFPKQWLIEDYEFTPEEADWLIAEVKRRAEAQS